MMMMMMMTMTRKVEIVLLHSEVLFTCISSPRYVELPVFSNLDVPGNGRSVSQCHCNLTQDISNLRDVKIFFPGPQEV